MFIEQHCKGEMNRDPRREAVKCSNSDCSMYLFLSLSKINFFVSLIGLILLATDDHSSGVLTGMQALIAAFALLHFILLVSSHISHTRCARSLAWRVLLSMSLVVKLSVIALTMYLTIAEDYDGGQPAWYLWLSGVLTLIFLVYEVIRTCQLSS